MSDTVMEVKLRMDDGQLERLADMVAKRLRSPGNDDTPRSVEQAAKDLNISVSTVRRRIESGAIKKIEGIGALRIPAEEIRRIKNGRDAES